MGGVQLGPRKDAGGRDWAPVIPELPVPLQEVLTGAEASQVMRVGGAKGPVLLRSKMEQMETTSSE